MSEEEYEDYLNCVEDIYVSAQSEIDCLNMQEDDNTR